ncbi:MAG: glycine zipper 2TM domain-containing protein [Bdellovibrionales bacterium]|nr:glycine zipper 2TM domain-containing protein [Ramlibacter sp.]
MACALFAAGHAMSQVTFYEGEGYRGQAFTTQGRVGDFTRYGFNDKASSVVVAKGRWEACEDIRFEGRCVILRPGSYSSLRQMGFNDRVSSVRPANNGRRDLDTPEPLAGPDYDYRRRPQERTYQVPVTSVRAVVGPPNQRCWIEKQQVTEAAPQKTYGAMGSGSGVGGAVVGGLLGGILGHQVGGGTGKDIATVAGAVGGAVIGNKVGNNYGNNQAPAQVTSTRDVQRCENVASTTPEFWDVTYNYRGTEHKVQMTAAPGSTITVNEKGEPRQ